MCYFSGFCRHTDSGSLTTLKHNLKFCFLHPRGESVAQENKPGFSTVHLKHLDGHLMVSKNFATTTPAFHVIVCLDVSCRALNFTMDEGGLLISLEEIQEEITRQKVNKKVDNLM